MPLGFHFVEDIARSNHGIDNNGRSLQNIRMSRRSELHDRVSEAEESHRNAKSVFGMISALIKARTHSIQKLSIEQVSLSSRIHIITITSIDR